MPFKKAYEKAMKQLNEKIATRDQADEIRATTAREGSVGSRLAARMRAQDVSVDDRRPRQSTRFRSRSRSRSGD